MKTRKKKAQFYTLTLIPKGGSGLPLKILQGKPWLFALSGAGVFVIAGVIMTLFILETPFRELFPGTMSIRQERLMAEQAQKVERMIRDMNEMQYFSDRMKNMIGNQVKLSRAAAISGVPQNAGTGKDYISRVSSGVPEPDARKAAVNPAKIVQGRLSQKFSPSRSHYGIDIATAKNTPVSALADGHVLFADWTSDAGYMLIVDHGDIVSFYKHCNRLLKKIGEGVRRGEVVALAGSTGSGSTGVHLHLEIWRNGVPVDPLTYIIEQ
jgi:murein DD-endopeptidase MepM/ murein hydrolase activator NlpD